MAVKSLEVEYGQGQRIDAAEDQGPGTFRAKENFSQELTIK